jgi:hypothetical protein
VAVAPERVVAQGRVAAGWVLVAALAQEWVVVAARVRERAVV